MSKPFTWSYSALEAFERCPKKHLHERILKDVVVETNAAQTEGIESHKCFEDYMYKNKPLPAHLKSHQPTITKIRDTAGVAFTEHKLALNRQFTPVGYFAKDVWVRGVVDYAKICNNSLLVVDWKFGKQQEGFGQLELMMAMMAAYEPTVTKFIGMYYWGKEKAIAHTRRTSDDVLGIWASFIPRVKAMQTAIERNDMPARSNFLCRNYCPVTTCSLNGAYL